MVAMPGLISIAPGSGVIRIPPGMFFRKGFTFCGVDVAETLDKLSAK